MLLTMLQLAQYNEAQLERAQAQQDLARLRSEAKSKEAQLQQLLNTALERAQMQESVITRAHNGENAAVSALQAVTDKLEQTVVCGAKLLLMISSQERALEQEQSAHLKTKLSIDLGRLQVRAPPP